MRMIDWSSDVCSSDLREVVWDGRARFPGNSLLDARPVNFLNCDKTLDRVGDDTLAWRALTTGNFGGFEAVPADPSAGSLQLETPGHAAGRLGERGGGQLRFRWAP